MPLASLLSDVGEFIVSHLSDEDVLRLVRTSKELRRMKPQLLKLLVQSHIPPTLYAPSAYLAVGASYFTWPKPQVYGFSMPECINEIIVCDFRAFLWGDVERCLLDSGQELTGLREYVLNGLDRIRQNASACGGFATYRGRKYLASQSLVRPRPVQYPSLDCRAAVAIIAQDLEFNCRHSFCVDATTHAVSVCFAPSPALSCYLARIGNRVPRWSGLVIRVFRKSVSGRRRRFYFERVELEEE
jgi:hypothetical protein